MWISAGFTLRLNLLTNSNGRLAVVYSFTNLSPLLTCSVYIFLKKRLYFFAFLSNTRSSYKFKISKSRLDGWWCSSLRRQMEISSEFLDIDGELIALINSQRRRNDGGNWKKSLAKMKWQYCVMVRFETTTLEFWVIKIGRLKINIRHSETLWELREIRRRWTNSKKTALTTVTKYHVNQKTI